MSKSARLICAASEANSDLYYLTRFLAPDSFCCVEIDNHKILLMNDLEVDRARAQAQADEVLSISDLQKQMDPKGETPPKLAGILAHFCNGRGVESLSVPADFPLALADALRETGLEVKAHAGPFVAGREVKNSAEIEAIEASQRAAERALGRALDRLRQSVTGEGDVLYWEGEVLTAEALRDLIQGSLFEDHCSADHTIVACGEQGVDPHNRGSGPLRAHQAIILDIFPRSTQTRYWADMTRTVVRGRAGDAIKRMYEAVYAGQETAFSLIRDGASGAFIHQEVLRTLEAKGFETGLKDGRMQGFFHGTGHGVGLDIHESPRISQCDSTLRAGNVVTVEPGLYYAGVGGVRLEDLVLVTGDGCRNLTQMEKLLEI
ncbi:MAG: aminopeptidase P family protein [Candidatus Omnitrophica bacterium]|nr:aminopeptidase P family protein [Candidatus Omnitrophota bacterium]